MKKKKTPWIHPYNDFKDITREQAQKIFRDISTGLKSVTVGHMIRPNTIGFGVAQILLCLTSHEDINDTLHRHTVGRIRHIVNFDVGRVTELPLSPEQIEHRDKLLKDCKFRNFVTRYKGAVSAIGRIYRYNLYTEKEILPDDILPED